MPEENKFIDSRTPDERTRDSGIEARTTASRQENKKESWEKSFEEKYFKVLVDTVPFLVGFGMRSELPADEREGAMGLYTSIKSFISTHKQKWEQEAYERGKEDARKSAEELAPEFGHEMEQRGIARGRKLERERIKKEWERVASEEGMDYEEMVDWMKYELKHSSLTNPTSDD